MGGGRRRARRCRSDRQPHHPGDRRRRARAGGGASQEFPASYPGCTRQMSWLQKLLPPKIQRTGGGTRKTVPEGLWTKCPACVAVLYSTDLDKNLNVCPNCGHHERFGARPPLDTLLAPHP